MKFKVKKVISKKKIIATVFQRCDLPLNKYQKCKCKACNLKQKTRTIKIPKGYSYLGSCKEENIIKINFIETL